MIKRILWFIVTIGFVILFVAGCSEFFGTIPDRVKVRQQAIAYIHNKYNVPIEQIKTDIPSYRYGTLRYVIHVFDTESEDVYFLSVRIRPKNHVEDLEEPKGNPIKE
ncbi:hypothetical protein [Brevibacillus borstelensis]|uniref:hypothetical protein n=1 Tax=Brevibacillus borstelensis TaxID=45462 RepID=UPI0004F28131|nr:hypothetical protein [Brevibacillus borstelensis]KKX52904.1 hypothetical protein X546_22370 [Brevibacillus borstelensis cifa_chp40]